MGDTKTERDKRLAAALRENLKRRKAQTRELDDASGGGPPQEAQKP